MQRILVATDADDVFGQVDAALGSSTVELLRVHTGREVRAGVLRHNPDAVVIDMQIGSMGGFAASLDLRLEESGDRLDRQRIVLLLDRPADVFLARRSEADDWILKPIDTAELRRTVRELIASSDTERDLA